MPSTLKNIQLWEDGIIPYKVNDTHPQWHTIKKAMEEFETKTNIRFIEHTDEPNYLVFTYNKAAGNHAFLGMKIGANTVNIVAHYRNVHELGHVIGLIHEHQRSDRNHYIDFHYENFTDIKSPWIQHDILAIHEDSINLTPYDINSIMHYWTTAGGKRAKLMEVILGKLKGIDFFNSEYRTMVFKPNPRLSFDTPEILSDLDCEAINRLYPLDQIIMPYFYGKTIDSNMNVILMHVESKNYLSYNSKTCQLGCSWKKDEDIWWNIIQQKIIKSEGSNNLDKKDDTTIFEKEAIMMLIHKRTQTILVLEESKNDTEKFKITCSKDPNNNLINPDIVFIFEKTNGLGPLKVGDTLQIYNRMYNEYLVSEKGKYLDNGKSQLISTINQKNKKNSLHLLDFMIVEAHSQWLENPYQALFECANGYLVFQPLQENSLLVILLVLDNKFQYHTAYIQVQQQIKTLFLLFGNCRINDPKALIEIVLMGVIVKYNIEIILKE